MSKVNAVYGEVLKLSDQERAELFDRLERKSRESALATRIELANHLVGRCYCVTGPNNNGVRSMAYIAFSEVDAAGNLSGFNIEHERLVIQRFANYDGSEFLNQHVLRKTHSRVREVTVQELSEQLFACANRIRAHITGGRDSSVDGDEPDLSWLDDIDVEGL